MKIALFALLVSLAVPTKLPELNAKIVQYLDSVMGKKVDRGECWDLAAGALAHAGAYFDRSSMKTIDVYGRLLNPDKEEIFPGDLIQFYNVKTAWKEGNTMYSESMAQHTAIVYSVNRKGDFQIAHQNTGGWGKKVGVSRFVLSRITSGKVKIYRPVKTKEEMK